MSWKEIEERDNRNTHARKSGQRVTEMIREAKDLLIEICDAAEEMEEEYDEPEDRRPRRSRRY